MTKLWLVSPLGILFAWSGAWTCVPVTLADGGTAAFNQNPAGGSGTQGGIVSGVVVTYNPDAGNEIGLMAGPDGGVTIGPAASFTSDFVYMSNSYDGTISRIDVNGALCPGNVSCEMARYFAVTPLDNHGANQRVIWGNQLKINPVSTDVPPNTPPPNTYYPGNTMNSPSRTVVDRGGNVWVALRAPGPTGNPGTTFQAGITEIANAGDNLAACVPKCATRMTPTAGVFLKNQPFTEGVTLNLTNASGTVVGTTVLTPPGIIGPGQPYSTQYACQDGIAGHDQTGTVVGDPVNYDDCVIMSIPLGDPTPDPLADPDGITKGTSFGRAAAMSPNCNPATKQCDLYLGMWNGTSLIHLGYSSPYLGGAPFDVVSRVNTGINPYGIAVDCAGVAWSGSAAVGGLAGVTTVRLNDPAANLNVAPDTIITPWQAGYVNGMWGAAKAPFPQPMTPAGTGPLIAGAYVIPNPTACGQYGISSDINENIWIGSYTGAAATPAKPLSVMCSFNAGALLADYAGYTANPPYIGAAQLTHDILNAWHTYDVSGQYPGHGNGRGINTDRFGNVVEAFDNGPSTAIGIQPNLVGPNTCVDGVTAGCAAVPCWTPTFGVTKCPNGTYMWKNVATDPGGCSGSIGVDFDAADDSVWVGNYGTCPAHSGQYVGMATQFKHQDGTPEAQINIGYGTYSYSDFTGYALRNITLSTGLYSQAFNGCGSSPEFTQWQTLAYDISTPVGTDAEIEVQATNSLSPAVLATETPIVVCQSVVNGNPPCVAGLCTPCNSPGEPINLAPFNIPGSEYLVVDVVLYPKVCALEGGAAAQGRPTLFSLDVAEFCPGN